MATLNEIIARAESLRKESYVNSINPERVGSIMSDTLKYLNEFQLQSGSMGLDKIYTSISAMNSDNAPVSDLTGKPLKGGQLAVIVAGSASEDNGKVYRFDNPGWTYVSTIGNLNIVQETGDSETAVMSQKAVTNLIEELKNAGYVFAGIATPETNPGTPDQNVFYVASENGTYSNFGGVTLTDEVAIFSNTNGSWVKSETGIATSAKVSEIEREVDECVIESLSEDFEITDESSYSIVQFSDGHIRTKYFDSRKQITEQERTKLNGIEDGAQKNSIDTKDTEALDLSIEDESGNYSIVQFSDGHIRTKYFDSRKISIDGKINVILNGDEICDYYAINNTGANVIADGYGCSHYIPCVPNGTLKITMPIEISTSGYGLAFYDSSKRLVSFIPNNTGSANSIETRTITIPPTATYFRVTFWNFANQANYGNFECELLMNKGKRPYQSGFIYFSQRVNQAVNKWWETQATDPALGVNYSATTGVLGLPADYSPDGKPVPLIIYCHGYSHGVWYGQWGATENFRTQKQHFMNAGFAVMDCNGARDSNRQASGANNFATAPQNVEGYYSCLRYVMANYNVGNVHIIGGSMGGQVCLQFCFTHPNIINSCILLSAHCNSHNWFNAAQPDGELYGLSTDPDGAAIDANPNNFIGLIPESRMQEIDGENKIFNFPPTKALYGSRELPETSNLIITGMKAFIDALQNGGCEATVREINGLTHSEVVSGGNVVVDSEIINWFNRY